MTLLFTIALVVTFAEAEWKPIHTLADFEAKAGTTMSALIKVTVAERGADWNAGCVIQPGLPMRRFVAAGESKAGLLLVYEHGGFAPHEHAVSFKRDAKAGRYTAVANVELGRVSDIADAAQALAARDYQSANHS